MLALIGGSAMYGLSTSSITNVYPATPFGDPSAPIETVKYGDCEVFFLPRHGHDHQVAAHLVNYRANIWALHELGVDTIVAACTAGGIDNKLSVGQFVVPNQIIDYTYGRECSFEERSPSLHYEFAEPFHNGTRAKIIDALGSVTEVSFQVSGTYGCVQGPRCETIAEIDRIEKDGCALVGMTLMPEAALAHELGISYAAVCLVVNMASGRGEEVFDFEVIRKIGLEGSRRIERMLEHIATA